MGNLEHNLTEGSVIKNLILFSLPFVGSFVLQSLYCTVDLFIVSHYAGTYSISGLNIVAQITDLVLGIAIGLLSAATVMIAQYVGAGKEKEIHKTIETTFTLVIILAVIMTIGMQIFMNPILHILQTPLESYQEASNYYRVVISGILFTFMYNAIANILRGMGDSKNPLYFVIISTGINIILDIIFVGKMHMGAGGAALATVIAQMCSVLVSIIYLRKIDFPFDFKLSSFHIDQEKIKIMFQIGIPSAFQNFMLNFSLVVLIAVANLLGVYASAAVGIAAKINVIFILPVIALHAALSAIVGQNVGAGKLKRVEKTAIVELIISSLYSLFICVIMWCFSKELLSIFTNDAQTLLVGANYFKGHCWDYVIVMPLAYCLSGIFIGSGHTSYVAVGNTVGALASRIPLAYFLSNILGWGTLGIGIAYPISTTVTNIVYIYYLIKGKWKTAVTTKDDMNLSE